MKKNNSTVLIVLSLLLGGALTTLYFNLDKYNYLSSYNSKNLTIAMTSNVMNQLRQKYESSTNEFIYCVYGAYNDNVAIIDQLIEPDDQNATSDSVTYRSCVRDSGYLGTIHSHPNRYNQYSYCYLSRTDVYTYAVQKEIVTGVMCGPEQFGFYNRENLDNSYHWEVIS